MNYDQIYTAALNGVPIAGELVKLRANAEMPLAEQRDSLQRECDKIKSEQASISETQSEKVETAALVNGLLVSAKARLRSAAKSIKRAASCLTAFQNRHGLPHDPIDPPVTLNVLIFSIMAFLEGFINASFFQSASMTANINQALLVSFLFSATNILMSCCGGFFIGRYKNYGAHTQDSNAPEFRNVRFRSNILFALFVAVMGFFHLTIGLVRTQETLGEIEHSLAAYKQLLHTPEAVLLVLIGLCLSVISYHKAKTAFSDPYPEYSAHADAEHQAQDRQTDLHEDLTLEVTDTLENCLADVIKSNEADKKSVKKYNKMVDRCYAAHRALSKGIAQAESQLAVQTAQVLDIYQGAGQQIAEGFDMERHCSFQSLLDIELPAYLPAPNRTAQIEHLNEAKVMALERLANLISETANPSTGETP